MSKGECHTKAQKTVSIEPEQIMYKSREADTDLAPGGIQNTRQAQNFRK